MDLGLSNKNMPSFTQLKSDDSCEIIIDRRIDGEFANKLEIDLLELGKTSVRKITLNMIDCSFICSAGIRVLLQYHRKMKTDHRSLMVSRASTEVDAILEMTGFRESFIEKAH